MKRTTRSRALLTGTYYVNIPVASNIALCDLEKPWGVIHFIHKGEPHEFYTMVNGLTGNRLTAFDCDPPSIDDPIKWIKSVFRDIRNKSEKVISQEGYKTFLIMNIFPKE